MVYRIIILAAIFTACGVPGPEDRGIEVTDDFKIQDQEKAMFTLEYMVEDHYGQEVVDLQFDSKVWWTDTPCPYKSEVWAVVHNRECFFGKMWSCKEMYVAKHKNNPSSICKTALLHEFGHCIRQYLGFPTYGDDHWDDEFWAVVAEANGEVCNRNWAAKDIETEMRGMEKECTHFLTQQEPEWGYK